MWIIAGLGNPGIEYALTRHNAGFMALDVLAARHGFDSFRKKFGSQASEGTVFDQKALLLKPDNFMNASGDSIVKAIHFYKIQPARLIVLHDELDLPFGAVRQKIGGGTAGHNGLNSIVRHLGQDFARIRIGIQKREVLGRFSPEELEALPDILAQAAYKTETLIKHGV